MGVKSDIIDYMPFLHLEDRRKYSRKNYLKNREKRIAYARKWQAEHKERVREIHKKSQRKNYPKYVKTRQISYYKRRGEIIKKLGEKCKRCGYNQDIRAFQFDHINGNGAEDRRRLDRRLGYHKHILANLSKFQLLCANCNQIKRMENKEHGYRKKFFMV